MIIQLNVRVLQTPLKTTTFIKIEYCTNCARARVCVCVMISEWCIYVLLPFHSYPYVSISAQISKPRENNQVKRHSYIPERTPKNNVLRNENLQKNVSVHIIPVSYTHLDVYKRQV